MTKRSPTRPQHIAAGPRGSGHTVPTPGFLRTEKEYGDYVLEGEGLFAGKGGQSGLLLHTREPDKVWPPSIEVQLDHGLVGNFVKIGDVAYEGGKRTENLEKPVGQWNETRIVARGGWRSASSG